MRRCESCAQPYSLFFIVGLLCLAGGIWAAAGCFLAGRLAETEEKTGVISSTETEAKRGRTSISSNHGRISFDPSIWLSDQPNSMRRFLQPWSACAPRSLARTTLEEAWTGRTAQAKYLAGGTLGLVGQDGSAQHGCVLGPFADHRFVRIVGLS